MRFTIYIDQEQPDELVMTLCRVMDAIRDAMDTSERRRQANVSAELRLRLQQFAELIDRLTAAG